MKPTSPWKLGGLTVKELGTRVYQEINDDDVFGRAAQLAYYFLLALFPLLLFVLTILGYFFADAGSDLRTELFQYLRTVVPADALGLVQTTMDGMGESASGGKLSFGILAALWAASNGMGAICDSLNVAYGVKESRPWWKSRLVAILLTIALAVLIISALAIILYGGSIGGALATKFGLGDVFQTAWKILQYPLALIFVLVAFALLYYFAPNLKDAKLQWVTPGSVIGVALWLLVSLGFSLYLNHFNSYNQTYGALGAVIILMLWFYLTGAAILVGGEINSEIEHAAAERGDPEAKSEGEKKPGDEEKGKSDTVTNARGVKKENAASGSKSNGKGDDGDDDAQRKARADAKATSIASATRRRVIAAHAPTTTSADRKLSFGKVGVALGGWLVSKLWKKR